MFNVLFCLFFNYSLQKRSNLMMAICDMALWPNLTVVYIWHFGSNKHTGKFYGVYIALISGLGCFIQFYLRIGE